MTIKIKSQKYPDLLEAAGSPNRCNDWKICNNTKHSNKTNHQQSSRLFIIDKMNDGKENDILLRIFYDTRCFS